MKEPLPNQGLIDLLIKSHVSVDELAREVKLDTVTLLKIIFGPTRLPFEVRKDFVRAIRKIKDKKRM